MKRLILGLAAVVALVGVRRAEGEVLTVDAESDAYGDDSDADGTFETLYDPNASLLRIGGTTDSQSAFALEFSLPSLPLGNSIVSAVLEIDVDGAG